nr:MAG TPA: hypothetical protein [Caudoviricetes sp.]
MLKARVREDVSLFRYITAIVADTGRIYFHS